MLSKKSDRVKHTERERISRSRFKEQSKSARSKPNNLYLTTRTTPLTNQTG
jgi:hypothetical protein